MRASRLGHSPFRAHALGALFGALALTAFSRVALAYRPFDGTDGDVAQPGEFELELGPVHYFRADGRNFLISPGGVFNLGLAPRLEAVMDFRNFVALGDHDGPRDRLVDTDLLAKVVLRRGTLQGAAGPSVAVEAGVLFPDSYPDSSFGAQADLIVSLAGPWAVLHWNEAFAEDRNHRLDLFTDVIVEVGRDLPVGPVAELFINRVCGAGSQGSALLGARWPYRDDLVFDVAARAARDAGVAAWEVRLGFTWAVVWWGRPRRVLQATVGP
jgi:hypothetical protein